MFPDTVEGHDLILREMKDMATRNVQDWEVMKSFIANPSTERQLSTAIRQWRLFTRVRKSQGHEGQRVLSGMARDHMPYICHLVESVPLFLKANF
jgi:hypothetical protein